MRSFVFKLKMNGFSQSSFTLYPAFDILLAGSRVQVAPATWNFNLRVTPALVMNSITFSPSFAILVPFAAE